LEHEYNILEKAGSSLGYRHLEETKTKISDAQKGNTNKKAKPRAEGVGSPSQAIEVFDLQEKTTISYNSKSAAARTCPASL
jgi:hypothetical protein